jgi:hypothetical protein
MKGLPARVPAVVVLIGTGAAAALVVTSSRRYPGVLQLSGAGFVLALTVVALLGYAACGVWALRGESAGYRTGLAWGALGGAMWSAEIWAGGPARLSSTAEQVAGGAFVLLALAATVTGGVLAGARIRRPAAAWRAGLLSGLVSGVVVYAFGVLMTLSTLPVLGSRSDYRAQFAQSHAPTMPAFLVGDILAAVAAHLIINLVVGLIGGGLGALIARTPRAPAPV